MKVSINEKIINKNENKANQSRGFKSHDLTPQQLAEHISQGFAFSYQFEKGHRKADNFICSDIIAADFDEGMTLDEAISEDFFINNASILYTTPSHTPEANRFRIIFELPRTITDKDELRAAQQGLTRKFPADRAAVDSARQFYGSRACEPHLFNKVLSEEKLDELIALGREPLNQSDLDGKHRVAGTRSPLSLDDDFMVRTSRGEMAQLSSLAKATPVYCPFHHDKKPSAFTTESRSGVMGVHCSSCQQTFWPKTRKPNPYDFYEFETVAHKAYNMGIVDTVIDDSGMLEFDVPNLNMVFSEQYLRADGIGIVDGITLIKSPKGSGKSKYLKRVVDDCKKRKLRVLLVGHRRSLLQALSKELGLTCYLDSAINDRIDDYYAISIDSLSVRLNPHEHKFDVVLVDESEQVFSHLIADTLESEKQRKSFLVFQYYISAARNVIAVDADLNAVTLHAIQRFGNKNPLVDRRHILNEYKPPSKQVEMYSSENHLVADMLSSLEQGHRLFVACNSKKRVEELVATIRQQFGDAFPLRHITGDNSNEPETIEFLKNIKNDILEYRVLLVSPAVGTGIDITFPKNLQHVDGVYGFFYSKINTHTDIDQQISRVRQPQYVKVWISPAKFSFEYEVDPIKQELAQSGIVPGALNGYDLYSGMPKYDLADPFLTLYATILSAQRASKNDLKKNFIELRQHNGWKIIDVARDDAMATAGSAMSRAGKAVALDQYLAGILAAPKLSWDEASALGDRRKHTQLSASEKYSLDRYWIEHFYGEEVTEALLLEDDRGRYREEIRRLEGLLQGKSYTGDKADKIRLLAKLIHTAGLLDTAGELDANRTVTMDSLQSFAKYCNNVQIKIKIERLLEMEVRKDLKSKPTSQLNAFLGLLGLKLVKTKTISKGDKKIYEYGLDRASYDRAMNLITMRSKPTAPPEDETTSRGTYEAPDPLDKH